jgi:nucleotide-binding universal stress UspA family protein
MIKDIIVNIELERSRDGVYEYAISVAELFDAYLLGIAFGSLISIPNYFVPELPPHALDDMLQYSNRLAAAAVERFEASTKRSALSAECKLDKEINSSQAENFSTMARHFDLSIVMQSDENIDNGQLIESALFDSGRPMIVVPFIQRGGLTTERIICCWDGSSAAARAINDSLPILKKAAAVELFTVTNEKTDGKNGSRSTEMANHLARHGVRVELTALPGADTEVANVILSHAADRAAGMIVMGGYGHSRLREFVLGGATRGILSTMTVPVFMSH